jgi:peptide/nickel transport system substrate-binding protein
VIAATGEPSSLFPPLVYETVGRDISDQIFERLAVLRPGAATIDSTAYAPALAERWVRVSDREWRFFLRPDARWHDGSRVTAEDVVFSFEAFADSALDAAARPALAGQVTAEAEDTATVVVRFTRDYPEQLYDATWHVRILPAHVWRPIPREQWPSDTALAHLVGSGPYRVAEWVRGQSLRLEAAPGSSAAVSRVVWRFAPDADAALNLLLSGEADIMEHLGSPARVERARSDTALRLISYPSAAYGFLGFKIQDDRGAAHPLLGSRALRRALAMAVNRPLLAEGVLGPGTKAPPGPMSRVLWILDEHIAALPYDTARAARLLDSLGWSPQAAGPRRRGAQALKFDILVPSTSPVRRDLAVTLQEAWGRLGIGVTVTAVDFPVFNERLARGQFDSYIGAWLDEPSPRGLADQWTRAGWGVLNYGHYDSPAFDARFQRAAAEADPAQARALWREAMDTLNADAPAVFLYAPEQVAAVSKRVEGVAIDPYSWASGLRTWRAGPR